jgi:glycosyltransferase involved in cell wall biosynthesis
MAESVHLTGSMDREPPGVATGASRDAESRHEPRPGGPRRSTVWMIIPSFAPAIGGAEAQVRRLSPGLRARGWDVRVLTRRHGPSLPRHLPDEEVIDGIPVIRVDSSGRGRIGSARYLLGGLRVLRRSSSPCIFHAHDLGTPGLLAALASRLFGGVSVVKLRTGASVYGRRFGGRSGRWVLKRILNMHDRIVVVNSGLEGFLLDLGIPAHRIVRIPNGVDPDQFAPVPASMRRRAREALGIRPHDFAILYVGRLAHVKGVDLLIRAWARIDATARARSTLLIAGDGMERGHLEALAVSLGVTDSCRFLGEREDVRELYGGADAFVLPSRSEGLSNALLEAMASQLAVIASDRGGSPDVIEHGTNGLLFDGEDEADLAAAIQWVISSPEQLTELGVRARRKAMAYASTDAVLSQLESAYLAIEPEC